MRCMQLRARTVSCVEKRYHRICYLCSAVRGFHMPCMSTCQMSASLSRILLFCPAKRPIRLVTWEDNAGKTRHRLCHYARSNKEPKKERNLHLICRTITSPSSFSAARRSLQEPLPPHQPPLASSTTAWTVVRNRLMPKYRAP